MRLDNLLLCIFRRGIRISYLEVPKTKGNGQKTQFSSRKIEEFWMQTWIKHEENSSSDARRGHLRSSKIPNFSKGESFPLWPPLSLRRRRWLSLVGDPRPPTCHFFHYHGGTYLKQYLKHEESIVEKNLTHLLSFIFWRRTRFWYLESAYGCLDTSKLQSNILHFQTPRKNS